MVSATDLVLLDSDELVGRLEETKRELFNLRFQLATGQLDNPARMGQVKRDVARILTVLRAREISEAEGTYVAPSSAEQEAARAHLAAADEAVAARAASSEAARAEDDDEDEDEDVEEEA